MKLGDKEISTIELEKMFYTNNPDDLKLIADALSYEMSLVEDGDNIQMDNIADNLNSAKELLEKRDGVFGVLVRATEIADAALDYYENLYFEELRQADEKKVTEANKDLKDAKKETKKLTDSVLKAQAAVKVAKYRRFRNFLNGYVRTCEKSLTALGIIVNVCDHEAQRLKQATYRAPEAVPSNSD